MADFILRYYYFLKDDVVQTESLVNVLKQRSLSVINSSLVPDFLEPAGFFFNLTDASGKMNILGIKAPAEAAG